MITEQPNSTTNINVENVEKNVRREEIDSALEKICSSNKKWLWLVFILCASPGVLNGIHITAYVFFAGNDPHYCNIPALEEAGWSLEHIKNVSIPFKHNKFDGCQYYNYNYSALANETFEKAVRKINMMKEKPRLLPCQNFIYENKDTVISEWDLVCDRFYYRSNIQSIYALGKFFGASFFGVIADKYGRKSSYTLAALCYAVSAILAIFSSNFGVFLFIRFLIGFGGVGCYGTTYTLLTELMIGKAKTWVCCAFNISYPIGIIIIACLAYYIHYWKTLLIIILMPTLILPFYYWLLPESPQWLLSNNRYHDAWKVLKNIDGKLQPLCPAPQIVYKFVNQKDRKMLFRKLMQPFIEFSAIFSTYVLMIRTLICFYIWFTVSITYNGLAINGSNFSVNQNVYLILNGIMEIFSYLLPIRLLVICGRKSASLILFSLTGFLLVSIMFVPKDFKITVIVFALLARFFCTSAYVIFALYTSELYPTSIRNTAIGASLALSHVGTFLSPYIVDIMGAFLWHIPSTIFGLLSFLCIFLLLVLPETKNTPLFNTIEEMNSVVN